MTATIVRLSLLVTIAVTTRSLWSFLHVPELPLTWTLLLLGSLLLLIDIGALRRPGIAATAAVLLVLVVYAWVTGAELLELGLFWWRDWQQLATEMTSGQLSEVPPFAGYTLILMWVFAVGSLAFPAGGKAYAGTLYITVSLLFFIEWVYNTSSVEVDTWTVAACGLIWLSCHRGYQGGRVWVALASSLLILVIVWTLPKPPRVAQGILEERLQQSAPLLAELRSRTTYMGPGAEPFQLGSTGFAQDESYLGGPVTLDPSPVLELRSGRQIPPVLYLRGGTKSRYTGRGWIEHPESDSYRRSFLRNGTNQRYWRIGRGPGRSPNNILMNVRMLAPGRNLFYSQQLNGLYLPDGQMLRTHPGEILMTDKIMPAESRYAFWFSPAQALSPETPDLQAGERELYTEIPETLPERVRELSRNLAADAANDLEIVQRIEAYLRENHTYTLRAGSVPLNRDFVDYFLFDARDGYCTYFASAMAVMLRTQGIPARWVTGFRLDAGAAGESESLLVRNMNAHAWVEVWLPAQGWVLFDPTPPGLPSGTEIPAEDAVPPDLSDTDSLEPAGDSLAEEEEALTNGAGSGAGRSPLNLIGLQSSILRTLTGFALIFLLVGALIIAWRQRRVRLREHLLKSGGRRASAAGMWLMEHLGSRYGLPRGAGETPSEYMTRIGEHFPGLRAFLSPWCRWLERQAFAAPDQESAGGDSLGWELWERLNEAWAKQSSIGSHLWRHYG